MSNKCQPVVPARWTIVIPFNWMSTITVTMTNIKNNPLQTDSGMDKSNISPTFYWKKK